MEAFVVLLLLHPEMASRIVNVLMVVGAFKIIVVELAF